MIYAVSQRTKEIGIRIAVGARPRAILRLVAEEGLRLGASGVSLGLLIASASSRVLVGLVHGISPTDPLTFTGVALLFILVSVVASSIPGLRAMRVDVFQVLRSE